jgi:hypothetical protein
MMMMMRSEMSLLLDHLPEMMHVGVMVAKVVVVLDVEVHLLQSWRQWECLKMRWMETQRMDLELMQRKRSREMGLQIL